MNKVLRRLLGAIGLAPIKKQTLLDSYTVADVLNRMLKKKRPGGERPSVVEVPIHHDICLAQAAILVADAINNKFDYVLSVDFLQDEALVMGYLKR